MNGRLIAIAGLGLGLGIIGAALFHGSASVRRVTGPLPNDVYVWQRVWTEPLHQALEQHATPFSELVVLAAEVVGSGRSARVVRVPVDYAFLSQVNRPVGLALRVGQLSGPDITADDRARALGDLAASLIQEALTNHVRVAELQIDFDCATAKLEGYGIWVKEVRRQIAPVPVIITALPAWLKHPAFKRLVQAVDGFVLQVHSLERPRGHDAPFNLCRPEVARHAVEQAARLGKPFRVALPTYGYRLAFDAKGRWAGLSAEGSPRDWPADHVIREVRADPNSMARLVREWTANRPATLRGVIWYRLPVEGDTLNWTWPTLAAVMAGEIPQSSLRSATRRPQAGLVEVDLINDGQAAGTSPVSVILHWRQARLVAADGLQGIDVVDQGADTIQFRARRDLARMQPGERRFIGWLRLNSETEVTSEVRIDNHD